MPFTQIYPVIDQNNNLNTIDLEKRRDAIEQEFQKYCKVFLFKRGNDYAIREWDIYYGWGERLFSLTELHSILNNYQVLEKLFPNINFMPFQKVEKRQMH